MQFQTLATAAQFQQALEERLRDVLRQATPEWELNPQNMGMLHEWVLDWSQPHSLSVERVVRPEGRPALVIQQGAFSIPSTNVWQPRLETSQLQIENAIPSVGQIKKIDNSIHQTTAVGTAWMVRPRVAITNRHVARTFAKASETGVGFKFRRGNNGVTPFRVQIDFQNEHEEADNHGFPVEEVLHMTPENGPDLALLRVADAADRQSLPPAPITLAADPARLKAGTQVVTIGYPAEPLPGSLAPGEREVNEAIFQAYGVKTLSPGEIVTVNPDGTFVHDCSTLEGNSGSVILDLESGEALGIHFHGSFLRGNMAVSYTTIREYLHSLGF